MFVAGICCRCYAIIIERCVLKQSATAACNWELGIGIMGCMLADLLMPFLTALICTENGRIVLHRPASLVNFRKI